MRLLSPFCTAAFVVALFLLPVSSSSPEVGRNSSSTRRSRHGRVRGVDKSSCHRSRNYCHLHTIAFVVALFLFPVASSKPEVGRNSTGTRRSRHGRMCDVDKSSCISIRSLYRRFISISGYLFVTGSRSESFEYEAVSSRSGARGRRIVVRVGNCLSILE